jgi:hypothetical protein
MNVQYNKNLFTTSIHGITRHTPRLLVEQKSDGAIGVDYGLRLPIYLLIDVV